MDPLTIVLICILAIPVSIIVAVWLGDLITMLTAPLLYLGEQEVRIAGPMLRSLRERIRTIRGTAVPAGRQSRRVRGRDRK